MEYKLLEEKDLELILDFVDDENTKYNIADLRKFIENINNYGFITKLDNKIIGFAYGYILLRPDGKKIFIYMLLILWKNIKVKVMEQHL